MTSIRLAAVVLASSSVAVLSACAKTDLGLPCTLTQPCSTGTCSIPPSAVENRSIDYVALGAAECDNFVCIRTTRSANPENQATAARGYCTSPCIDAQDCSPDYNGKSNKMICDRIVFDEAFLDRLKKDSPEEYEQILGNGISSKYCILPRQ